MTARSVIVLGDIMLDVSENGSAHRLSPEAPVVVLLNPVTTVALGGAANTAANVRSLGLETTVIGAVGDDRSGEQAVELLAAAGIESRVVVSATTPTTTKTRFLADRHQIMRRDTEVTTLEPAVHAGLLAQLMDALPTASALVISDYLKGAIEPELARSAIELAVQAGVPVVVDTKRTDVGVFHGSTIIAPNHHEAERMTGHADPARAAADIAQLTGGSVLVTLGADGMLLLDAGLVTRIPSHAHEVADVTGAGDTVTAALAVAFAEGASSRQAAAWANWAAAEAVSHPGTYAVPRSAIQVAIEDL